MTSASSFQMLRGSVVVFTGLLSVAFLGRRLELSQWLGIGATILGLLVVGLADLRGGRGQQHRLSEVITGRQNPPPLGEKPFGAVGLAVLGHGTPPSFRPRR